MFEAKKAEIEARKEQKRKDSASLKEKLEAANVEISMPAGNNGKLYGAVTSHTIADALKKEGFEIERKRIDVPGLTIKSVGKYVVTVRLYESAVAEVTVDVVSQDGKSAEEAKKDAE